MKNVSRRGFLGVGAASAAAFAGMGLAGCAPKQAERVPSTDGGAWSWETAPEAIADIASVEEADVVVIGAGMAGMSAACSAAEKGAKVVLLEKTGAAQFRGIDYGAIGGSLQLEVVSTCAIARKTFFRKYCDGATIVAITAL